MLGYDDKRNFYRMMVNSPCSVSILDNEEVTGLQAVCRDISATGMSIELERNEIDLGSILEIVIESNNEQIPSLVAKAKVVRCDTQNDDCCLVGVEISEMN